MMVRLLSKVVLAIVLVGLVAACVAPAPAATQGGASAAPAADAASKAPVKLILGAYTTPVSYTHLDVYKRQLLAWVG